MKKYIENFLVWALGKLNKTRYKNCSVDHTGVTIGFESFVPDDQEWHNIVITTTFWIKNNKNGTREGVVTTTNIHKDGELKSAETFNFDDLTVFSRVLSDEEMDSLKKTDDNSAILEK